MALSRMLLWRTNNTDAVFWQAIYAYWHIFPEYASKGSDGYSMIFPRGPPGSGYAWTMQPWLVPGMALADFRAMVAPLFAQGTALGFSFTPQFFEHDNVYDTWSAHFPTEAVANGNEGDSMEPDFAEAFFGTNYQRLREIKR
ncbi:hypothetical protein BT67DRAFT_250505 [Trichocladium antarcticum]|uniref:Berberine/berberine-like domain-containing protein n=1 Tax=Trichocladium antarcticum TaxID=1450529 RepID=A0AAN6Z8Q8_9PEZI|nr:hypothetical protein BT67DRAFT_250505 [Trichocladium antarcticum]